MTDTNYERFKKMIELKKKKKKKLVDSQSTTFLTVDSAIEINNIIKKIYIYGQRSNRR